MSEWIKTEDEYPPCDGLYFVSMKQKIDDVKEDTVLEYDGICFKQFGMPVIDPIYWKFYSLREKRYGKRSK